MLNLSGQTFGRWFVLSEAPSIKRKISSGRGRTRYWNVRCVCGKEKVISQECLRSGKSRSCGCLRREESVAKHSKPNGESAFNKLLTSYAVKSGKKRFSFYYLSRNLEA